MLWRFYAVPGNPADRKDSPELRVATKSWAFYPILAAGTPCLPWVDERGAGGWRALFAAGGALVAVTPDILGLYKGHKQFHECPRDIYPVMS